MHLQSAAGHLADGRPSISKHVYIRSVPYIQLPCACFTSLHNEAKETPATSLCRTEMQNMPSSHLNVTAILVPPAPNTGLVFLQNKSNILFCCCCSTRVWVTLRCWNVMFISRRCSLHIIYIPDDVMLKESKRKKRIKHFYALFVPK